MSKIRYFILLWALTWSVLLACAPSPSQPAALSDDMGRSVSLDKVPSRIISLAPSITEILYALGLGDKVVGVDDYSDYPKEATAKPKMGAPFPGFNMETIVSQSPDVILSVRGEYVSQLEARGFKVIVLQPKDFDGILANIRLVGRLTGSEKKAEDLTSQLAKRVSQVKETAVKATSRPKVFYEIDATDPTKPWTAGPGSFIHDMITMAGGENVAAKAAKDYVQMSAEEIINLDPEIILLGDTKYGTTLESVVRRPGWDRMAAVKKAALIPIEPDLTSRPGPRIVDGLEKIARIIHPELFK